MSRLRIVVLGVALVALAFGVSAGLAKSGPSKGKVGVQWDGTDNECVDDYQWYPANKPYKNGTATISREKGVVKASIHLRGAVPGSYKLYLYHGDFDGMPTPFDGCHLESEIGSFKVDGSGDGNKSGTYAETDYQWFLLIAYNEDTGDYYQSEPVKLGSS